MLNLMFRILFVLLIFFPLVLLAQNNLQNSQSGQDPMVRNKPSKEEPDSNSFFLISAIKTVSGIAPESEFFDILAKYHFSKDFFGLAGFDMALTARETDTVRTSTKKLTEASLILNYSIASFDNNKRQLFFNLITKVFNAEPYYGIGIGSMENKGAFATSYTIFALLKRFYDVKTENISKSSINQFNGNLYFEAGIYSDVAPIVKNIRIKIGALLPLPFMSKDPKPTVDDIDYRIVLEIPIAGTPFKF